MKFLAALALVAVLAACDSTETTPKATSQCEDAMRADATYTTSRSTDGQAEADQATLTACDSVSEWVAAEQVHDVALGNTPPVRVLALFCADAPADVQQRQICVDAFAAQPDVTP